MKESTLALLEKAREDANVPFIINSGFRCEKHNKEVGGKSEGAHTTGYAVDIEATDSLTRYEILDSLLKVGFNRIGIADTFIHVDNDPTKPRKVVWVY